MSAHDIWDLIPGLPEEDERCSYCSGALHDYCIECGAALCHDHCIYISGDAFCEDCC